MVVGYEHGHCTRGGRWLQSRESRQDCRRPVNNGSRTAAIVLHRNKQPHRWVPRSAGHDLRLAVAVSSCHRRSVAVANSAKLAHLP